MDTLRVAAEARGFFTRGEARAVGLDDRTIAAAIRHGAWVRVRRGSYTFPDLWPAGAGARHRITGRAVAARLGPGVALSHTTAAIEHGLTVWGADLSTTHLTRLDGVSGRTEAGVRHHEGRLLPGDVVDLDGVPVTRPTRAAVEAASLLSTEAAVVLLDSALRLGSSDRADLDATYAAMSGWPGMLRASLAVRLADGRAASAGESRARYLCYTQQLPAPVLQYDVRDASGEVVGTTDFAWPELRLLGEFDGRVKYGRLRRPGETPGDAVFREKRREDLLVEITGWRMVRLVWADLADPRSVAARIRRQMAVAA